MDLRTQARNVDFSGAPQTKSSKAGTVLPATCSTGETFFKIDAPAGLNLYGCKPDNVWSLLSGGTSSLPPVAGAEGKVLTYDGSAPQWSALAGDVQGTPGVNSVHGLQGRSMSGAAPFNNDVLTWNEASSQWQPAGASVQAGSGINVAANSISMDDAVVPLYYTGSGAPQFPCTAGRDYYVDLVSVNLYFCGAVNVWQAVSKTSPLLSAGDIVSGTLALARGGTQTDLSTTGGAGQFLKQSSSGAAVTVGAIASADLPSHTHAAADVTSGTLALARGGTQTDLSTTGGAGQFLKQSSSGAAVTVGAIASTDLPAHTHAATDVTSGKLALARGGTLADLSATGGAGQFLKQSSNGAAVTVGTIASTDLPSHTHAATDVTSGTLALARGGTLADLSATGGAGQFLKQSSTGAAVTVGAIASTDLPTHTHAATDVTSGKLALARGGTNQSAWQAGTCVQVNSSGTALESAASACGSGGGTSSLPASSGLGYFFPFGAGQEVTSGSFNLTANKIGYFQFVSTPMSINRLVYEAGTALSGGTSWNFAIYGSDCATLVTSGSYSGTASGGVYVGVPLSPAVSLGYGVFYLMIAYPGSGTPGMYGWNSSADVAKMGNTGSLVRVGISSTSFSGSWPASGTNLCSGGAANMVNMPYMMMDFQ